MKIFSGLSFLGIAGALIGFVGTAIQNADNERRIEQMIDDKIDERLAKNDEDEDDE